MTSARFSTAPVDLVEYLERGYKYFKAQAYTVRTGVFKIGYPNQPSFVCSRTGVTLYIEVCKSLSKESIGNWKDYCASQPKDSRFGVLVPESLVIPSDVLVQLTTDGIGLYIANASAITTQIPPKDQAVSFKLPTLGSMPVGQRPSLAPVYEKCGRGEWIDGCADACQVLEDRAREHLKWLVAHGNEVLDKNGNPRALNAAQINRFTLGQLLTAYENLRAPTQLELQITQAVSLVKKNRNDWAHGRNKKSVRDRLRKSAGADLWVIFGALRLL